MYRVVVADFIADELEPERRVLAGLANVEAVNARCEDDLVGRIEDADAVMMYHSFALTHRSIVRLARCKVIVRCGVGVDNVDHAFAATRGIPVANVPDYGTEEVADTAVGMMLALARGIHRYDSALRDGRGPWSYTQAVPLRRLRGSRFGIVGLGRVGTAAAIRAKALGMEVVFYDPFKPDGYDKALGVRRSQTLQDLLGQSYVLSLHCPLTDQTRHLIDAAALAEVPPGSILINTARGEVMDLEAILPALSSGRLAGVGLDVLPQEPPAGNEAILCAWRDASYPAHDRIIINPHAAFYSEQSLLEMRIKGAEACRQGLLGQPLRNLVNFPGRAATGST